MYPLGFSSEIIMPSLSADYSVSFPSFYLPSLFFLPIDQVKTYSNKLDMNAEGKSFDLVDMNAEGKSFLALSLSTKKRYTGRSQDGRGTGRGDHLLPYKFIERTFGRWAYCTKQLLTTSRGHQAPRKAAHHLLKESGKDIKDKKRDKRARDGDLSWEGSRNRGSFRTPGKPLADLGETFESRRAT